MFHCEETRGYCINHERLNILLLLGTLNKIN